MCVMVWISSRVSGRPVQTRPIPCSKNHRACVQEINLAKPFDWLLIVTSFRVKRGRRPTLARKTWPLGVKIICGLSKKDIVSIAMQRPMAKRACSAVLGSESLFGMRFA